MKVNILMNHHDRIKLFNNKVSQLIITSVIIIINGVIQSPIEHQIRIIPVNQLKSFNKLISSISIYPSKIQPFQSTHPNPINTTNCEHLAQYDLCSTIQSLFFFYK